MNNCDKEKVLIGYCLTANNREGAWPYYDCKNIIDKYKLCLEKKQIKHTMNTKVNTKN